MSNQQNSVNRRQFLKGSLLAGAGVLAAGGVATPAANAQRAPAGNVPAKWDKEADIVIVGTGHAGLAAAIAAVDAGAKVVILEKMCVDTECRRRLGVPHEPADVKRRYPRRDAQARIGTTTAVRGACWPG